MARLSHDFDEHDYALLAGIRGVIALLIGGIAVLYPSTALESLVFLVGGYALADGLNSFATALAALGDRRRSVPFFAEALVDVGFAAALLLAPALTVAILIPLVAVWAAVTGTVDLLMALLVDGDDVFPLAVTGLVSVGLAAALVLAPALTVTTLVIYLGVKLLVFGGAQIGLAVRLA